MRVETVDEETLDRFLESRLTSLIEGNPHAASDVLAQFALENVHHELAAPELWAHLEKSGFARQRWFEDEKLLKCIADTVDRYELRHSDASIGGYRIERSEARMVLDKLVDINNERDVLVVSEAGGGKSQVLLQVVESMKELGWPMIAFAVDRLTPTPLPEQVGDQLKLPSSPPHVLAGIARDCPCVLVIDQLDAVSLASGRHPKFYEVIREIIGQAKTHSNMKVLLACRRFDLDNDYRLKGLSEGEEAADVVTVSPLELDVVKDVIAGLGVDHTRLNERQLSLLSNPLHLSLFAETARGAPGALGFQSAKDLFDLFWDRKQASVSGRLGVPARFADVVQALSDWMSTHQALFAPQSVLDEWDLDAKAMTSEHVLVRADSNTAFFHESFFDYAFARRFVARGQDIAELLASAEQHLFRRAEVRQILVHERYTVREQYLNHLSQLLLGQGVRTHVSEVVIGLIAATPDPWEDEWRVLEAIDREPNHPLRNMLWRGLYGKDRWFELLRSLGVIKRMLSDSERARADLGVQLLRSVQRTCPDEVAELVRPYAGLSDSWNLRLVWLIEWSEVDASRQFFDLFLELIDRGLLDEARGPIAANSEFWSLLTLMPNRHPQWVCEAIRHYLDRRLDLSLGRGQPNPFDRDSGTIPNTQLHREVVGESARRAPRQFIDNVLPFMLRVIGLTVRQPAHDGVRQDPIWSFRIYGGGFGLDDDLLTGIEVAFRQLATSEPDYVRDIVGRFSGLDSETVQFVMIRALAANGEALAEDAIDYLFAAPGRFEAGYVSDSHWAARELLDAITPYCSAESLERLEGALLNYYPDWERTTQGRHSHGHAQFELLGGITEFRRSQAVIRRLQELGRRFGGHDVTAPEPLTVKMVESPIPAIAAAKMSDAQWLRAIKRYSRRDREKENDLRGGPHQLSQVLEAEVRNDPGRFVNLADTIPNDAHPYFFDAILRGVSDAEVDVERAARICRRCHEVPDRPSGRWLCRLVQKVASSDVPTNLLDMVAWYATEDPDPNGDVWRTTPTGSDSAYYGGDIVSAGLNSSRGAALLAIAALIFYEPGRTPHLMPTLETAVSDPVLSVRAWATEALRAVLTYDRDLSVDLALRLLDGEEVLLQANTVERLLRDALPTHYSLLRPIVERMLQSGIPEVVSAGSRQASLVSLVVAEAQELAEACMEGTPDQRKGAAQVFAANLGIADHRDFCEASLLRLFSDPDEEVRKEAATCFRHLGAQPIDDYTSLVASFLDSQAFQSNFDDLIFTLDRSEASLPEFTYRVCARFLDVAGVEAGDIRAHTAATATEVSRLIMRLYSQTKEEATRSRCLDVIDSMSFLGTYGLDAAMELYER